MKAPRYFIELQSYTELQIQDILNINAVEYKRLEVFLLENDFLRLDIQHYKKFHFVGVLAYENNLLIILPKYVQLEGNMNEVYAAQLFKVLLKFMQSNTSVSATNFHVFRNEIPEIDSSQFIQAEWIMKDYIEHGLYHADQLTLEINGFGEIDWYETIETDNMIISNGSPFYPELHTYTPQVDELNLIHQLHQAILNEVSVLFEQFKVLGIFHYETIHFDYTLEELGEIDYLLYALEREMQVAFSDQKLRLLTLLMHYLENKKSQLTQQSYTVFGTKSFHIIWEQVCGHVFGNQYHTFKKWIPKPQWLDFHSGEVAEVATLIPDLLLYKAQENAFYIFDAKYYSTQFKHANGKLIIQNNPGVADVTKQYLYEQTLKKHRDVSVIPDDTHYYNLFIMPHIDPSDFFGHVSLDIFVSDFKGVFLYRQNAAQLFECYLTDSTLPTAPLKLKIDALLD